ncbi:BsuBI/PstI family type II restriction endonuclease [Amorphoplanes digitatis]|uniref:Restriction endonuclease n=1 Tax=Actinoplanes digitatis TaxID=1868 RepID=A0A7W7I2M0_9ACTN|nr:BsuBI/PstI family type II restriction endonuclease [Actinoplanes digitatis]MBB4765255.1 hypothetical protein [Actinoplanes digitatis]
MTQSNPSRELPALLEDREAYLERLQAIVPSDLTGTTATANPIAAAAALTLMYTGAIDGQNPVRPLALMRMNEEIAAHRTDDERRAYYAASRSSRGSRAIDDLCAEWGVGSHAWYQTNSREGVRDETFHRWEENGVLLWDRSVPTTSSVGRYSLVGEFAKLLSPVLQGEQLSAEIAEWQSANLTPTGRMRALTRADRAKAGAMVTVTLPGGASRVLNAGSETLAAFLELGAPKIMGDPAVVFISQSGEPVNIVDERLLTTLHLDLKKLGKLPDCLIVDVLSDRFWFVEVVDSDGPVHDERKKAFLAWAVSSGIAQDKCSFLTVFQSRAHSPAKKALPQLALNSTAWYADEPGGILTWSDIGS